jgi:hypothetical protein
MALSGKLQPGTILAVIVLVSIGWFDLIAPDPERVRLTGHVLAGITFVVAALCAMRIARRVRMYRIARRGITLAILLPPAVFTLLDR